MNWFLTGPFLYLAALVFFSGTAYKIAAAAAHATAFALGTLPHPAARPEGSKYQQVGFDRSQRQADRLAEMWFYGPGDPALEEGVPESSQFVESLLLVARWAVSVTHLSGVTGLAALLLVAGFPADTGMTWGLQRLSAAAGGSGLTAGLLGALWLICLRLKDRDLRVMSDAVALVNLTLLLAVFAAGLFAWLTAIRGCTQPERTWSRSCAGNRRR